MSLRLMKLCSFFTLNILTVPRTRYSAFISELLVQPGKILFQIYNLFPGLPVLHLEPADFLGVLFRIARNVVGVLHAI